jgi:hypothetical protein
MLERIKTFFHIKKEYRMPTSEEINKAFPSEKLQSLLEEGNECRKDWAERHKGRRTISPEEWHYRY